MKLTHLTDGSFSLTSKSEAELNVIEKAMKIENHCAEEVVDGDTIERIYGRTSDTRQDVSNNYSWAKKETEKERATARKLNKIK